MSARAYYNEIDPYAAQWLRNLIAAGHIAPGEVDTRSIEDVCATDLVGFTQCHFFAGIAGWSLALRLAGWPDTRPVWTGSCPCQPYSRAGKGEGNADERNLWPAWFHLISERRPPVIFGEQVEAAIAHGWLDLVQDDLEGVGYAFAPAVFPAASVGAPHIRHRLWWVADSMQSRWAERRADAGSGQAARGSDVGSLADGDEVGRGGRSGSRAQGHGQSEQPTQNDRDPRRMANNNNNRCAPPATPGCEAGECDAQPRGVVDNSVPAGLPLRQPSELQGQRGGRESGAVEQPSRSPLAGFWRDADWLICRDGKSRPVEPGSFPLARRLPNHVGRLRAYGNAIVPACAQEIIAAFMESIDE